MRIGILGTGKMGQALGLLWSRAGHEIVFGSRDPRRAHDLTQPGATVTTLEQAAKAEVALVVVPYHAMVALGERLGDLLADKTVLDAGNASRQRDGEIADQALAVGTGVFTQSLLPRSHVVKAYNTVYFKTLATRSHSSEERIAVPLASDFPEALRTASGLVRDSGFEPVVTGALDSSKRFDMGTPVWNANLTARELRAQLGLGS